MVPIDLLWPGFLLLLGLVPLVSVAYVWGLRRRRRATVRYSSLSLIRAAQPDAARWRRHFPFALFLLALVSLAVAASRPAAIVSVPANQTTIILAIDVSRSMCSTDIPPSRLEAAQAAMFDFIDRQPAGTQMGIVAFSGFAELIQPPTMDRKLLQAAVESLMTGRRTAIGSAIIKSIDTIAEIDKGVARTVTDPADAPTPVARGAYVPEIIVLLTDGANNAGRLPLEAAQQSVDRGIRIYTIGFGTANGSGFPNCQQQFIGNEPSEGRGEFGGGGGGNFFGGGGGFRRGIDEVTLKQVADATGGEYYSAESAGDLNRIFQDLPTNLIMRHETQEISVAFVAVGAMLAVLAMAFALLWNPLP